MWMHKILTTLLASTLMLILGGCGHTVDANTAVVNSRYAVLDGSDEPVIGGTAKDIPAAAAPLRSSSAMHYWNPTGDFGRQMSHVLGYWNRHRWLYAWDTWLAYSPDTVWSSALPPKPAFLMHQLGGL